MYRKHNDKYQGYNHLEKIFTELFTKESNGKSEVERRTGANRTREMYMWDIKRTKKKGIEG